LTESLRRIYSLVRRFVRAGSAMGQRNHERTNHART